jgi:hypothetical protein
MPPLPEVTDVLGLVRGIEIYRQLKSDNPRYAYGHIGIPGEIEIQLKAVGQQPNHA